MFKALQTTLSLDDALDLLDIDEVHQSWRAAGLRNADATAEIIRKRRGSHG